MSDQMIWNFWWFDDGSCELSAMIPHWIHDNYRHANFSVWFLSYLFIVYFCYTWNFPAAIAFISSIKWWKSVSTIIFRPLYPSKLLCVQWNRLHGTTDSGGGFTVSPLTHRLFDLWSPKSHELPVFWSPLVHILLFLQPENIWFPRPVHELLVILEPPDHQLFVGIDLLKFRITSRKYLISECLFVSKLA